jgi:hypothetical protein
MAETPLSEKLLVALANVADAPGDAVVKALAAHVVKRRSLAGIPHADRPDALFPELLREIRRDTGDVEMHGDVRKFLLAGGEIDGVMDKGLVRHAQTFFGEHGVAIIAALFHASLPEAYLGRRGVQALDMTGELVSNWTRRIQDTGQFLINVMSPAPYLMRLEDSTSLSAGRFGSVAIRRVRLTHAAVRLLLSAPHGGPLDLLILAGATTDPPTRWEVRMIEIGEDKQPLPLAAEDAPPPAHSSTEAPAPRVKSQPLNQEDLLATLGTFTTVTFDALEKLAVPLDEHDKKAFYHLWNVVAWHLGIGDAQALTGIKPGRTSAWPKNKLLPLGVEEMDSLYRRLAQRLQAPTEQGRRLAKTLVQELAYPLPRPLQGAPEFIVRYFVGDGHADALDIGRGGYAELLIRQTGALERVARRAPSSLVGRLTLRPISQLVTRYALRAFVAQSRGRGSGVTIEPGIASGWGIDTGSEVGSPLRA